MLKALFFISLAICTSGCLKSQLPKDTPRCIVNRIKEAEKSSNPDFDEVWRGEIDGEVYYRLAHYCCDPYDEMYDSECHYICAPSVHQFGPTQGGDCPIVSAVGDDWELIWFKKD